MFESNYRRLLCLTALLTSCCTLQEAHAQLFGARNVGNTITSPFAPGGRLGSNSPAAIGPDVGLLDGSERFVRGNRSRRDFVGSDRTEQSGFVGASQAIGVGRVQSATEGLRIDATDVQRVNRPLPPQAAKGLYYPRLEIDFDVTRNLPSPLEEAANRRMHERIAAVTGSGALLVLEGRTAILRGTVPTQHAGDLAERLLSFEPGIDRVQNELRIAP